MRYFFLFLYTCPLLWIFSCRQQEERRFKPLTRDTTITAENAFTQLFLDSAAVASFIERHPMHDSLKVRITSFYNGRNYQFAWFFPNGLADYAHTFLNMQQQYIHYSGDSTLYNADLENRINSLAAQEQVSPSDTAVIQTELILTRQFFRYAYFAYSGDRQVNLQDLGWFIPRRKLDLVAFLDSLISNKGNEISGYEPVNRQYGLLRENLIRFHEMAQSNEWVILETPRKPLREGDSSQVIRGIRRNLAALGYLIPGEPDSLASYTPGLTAAVKDFQKHHGLDEDGIAGASLFKEMNTPVSERISQLLLNMERMRWMPAQPESDYLLINIPEFRLHAYEKGRLAFSMNVVVGATAHNTVIFSGILDQIVFSPYWNIPNSILQNEILPALKRNPIYLARHQMEWHGNGIRQKPGPHNSLGLVKFLFPNNYNIYLHDTPSKNLFNEPKRAFSHGCIRLSEPVKLAEFLLRDDPAWTKEDILAAMNAGREKYVKLKPDQQVPVIIGYFTAWVDKEGKLNFRNDIYGHDQKMRRRYLN